MDAPAWMIDLLFKPQSDETTQVLPFSEAIDNRYEWNPSLSWEVITRWCSLIPFALLVAILLVERGIIIRQKYFKYGLIAIMTARFACDVVPTLTATFRLFMSSDQCTAVTMIMTYYRDLYEATLTSVTISRLFVAYQRFPASVWWKILVGLLVPLVLSIPLSLVNVTVVESPYCQEAFIGTLAVKSRLCVIIAMYAANVIMGVLTIRKLITLRRKAMLTEQFQFTIVIWLMSVIPFIAFLLTITIGYQWESTRFYLIGWMDLLRESGLGIYSLIIIVYVPRVRNTLHCLIWAFYSYCCSWPQLELEVELESRPFKKNGARTLEVAMKERYAAHHSPSTSI